MRKEEILEKIEYYKAQIIDAKEEIDDLERDISDWEDDICDLQEELKEFESKQTKLNANLGVSEK